jgi:UDP-glucose 6-dehydrogenase
LAKREREREIMNIICTELYEQQLKNILQKFAQEDFTATKKFKLYLDTIILNMPTKAKKFKQSIYFDDENIKDIEHQGFIIPFYLDEKNDNYLILGIVEK